MIAFADLKREFAVLPVKDLGDCIAIPGEQFDLDGILMFLEEGYRFEGSRLDRYPVVLVQAKPLVIDSPDSKHGILKKEALN
jgi:hypothetical protein